MPFLARNYRERVRERDRARATGSGNEIVLRERNAIWILIMDEVAEHYLHSQKYDLYFSKPLGYYDYPPLKFPIRRAVKEHEFDEIIYKPIGAPQSLLDLVARLLGLWKFDGTVYEYSQTEVVGYPDTLSKSIIVAAKGGGQGVFVPSLKPSRIFSSSLPIRLCTILADPNNVAPIWTGYNQAIAKGNAFPLHPGAARDYEIDDLSKIWLLSENAGDRVFFIYET